MANNSNLAKTKTPDKRSKGFRTHAPIPASTENQKDSIKTESHPPRSPSRNARNAPPMKKRAKGSGFVGLIFLLGFASLGYFVWVSLLQYQSYGIIQGRVISVASPWDGTLFSWQVRDGDRVVQGQILAEISNLKMDHELATLGDDLKMSQAQLDAEISKIHFETQDRSEHSQKAVAEYLKTYGELLNERSRLEQLSRTYDRTKRLKKSNNVSQAAYERVYFELSGQRKKLEKLTDAVEVLRTRSVDANRSIDDRASRLQPILTKIEVTQSRITRLRERIDQGKIRAPISGRIAKRLCLTGEASKAGEPILDILEDNSIEAVLYVPQWIVDEFTIGNSITIVVEPNRQPLTCKILRFGDKFQPAPKSIERFYNQNQPLLPVYLEPDPDAQQLLGMRVGGTVKRPYEYRKALQKMIDEARTTLEL